MNRILSFILALFALNVVAQQSFDGAAVKWKGNPVMRFERTLTNNTDTAISFSFAHLPETDSAFMQHYVLQYVKTPKDTEQSKLDCLNAVAKMLRNTHINESRLYTNPSGDPMLYSKEHSLVGMLHTVYSMKCHSFWEQAKVILLKTGYFKYQDFNDIHLDGHSFGEVKLRNRFAMCDFDPDQKWFMIVKENSPNKFASYQDIVKDTTLITNAKRYIPEQPILELNSLSTYRKLLSRAAQTTASQPNKTLPVTGKFVMPPHSKLSMASQWMFFLDTTDKQSTATLTKILRWGQSNCCQDSIMDGIYKLWRVKDINVLKSLYSNIIVFYNPKNPSFNSVYGSDTIAQMFLSLNHNDTLTIGKDVQAPLYLTEVKGNDKKELTVGDATFTGNKRFILWGETEGPALSNKEVNYLTSGTIAPGEQTIGLAVNTNVINFSDTWKLRGGKGLTHSIDTYTFEKE